MIPVPDDGWTHGGRERLLLRGREVSRLEALNDTVLGFAITLLLAERGAARLDQRPPPQAASSAPAPG
jgi:hypothetical protein